MILINNIIFKKIIISTQVIRYLDCCLSRQPAGTVQKRLLTVSFGLKHFENYLPILNKNQCGSHYLITNVTDSGATLPYF